VSQYHKNPPENPVGLIQNRTCKAYIFPRSQISKKQNWVCWDWEIPAELIRCPCHSQTVGGVKGSPLKRLSKPWNRFPRKPMDVQHRLTNTSQVWFRSSSSHLRSRACIKWLSRVPSSLIFCTSKTSSRRDKTEARQGINPGRHRASSIRRAQRLFYRLAGTSWLSAT